MKMQEVRLKAKNLGINSFGKTKAELIREIQRKEGNFDCFGSAQGSCDQETCCFRSVCLGEAEKTPKTRKTPSAKVKTAC